MYILARLTGILIVLVSAVGCTSAPGPHSNFSSQASVEAVSGEEITDPVMQYQLGMHYLFGVSVPQSYGKALTWFKKSARQGYLSAQNNLGTMYAQGLGVSRDYKEAFKWLDQAARRGSADAQQNLGLMYASGLGVSKDYRKAFMWFRLAAAQGHPGAQAQLGGLYAEGHGVERDDAEAAQWFLKAAAQGNPYAQYHLGLRYQQGRGLPADRVEAYKWVLLSAQSAADEDPGRSPTLKADLARMREQLETELTPEQKKEAREKARQWKPVAQENSPHESHPHPANRGPKTVKS